METDLLLRLCLADKLERLAFRFMCFNNGPFGESLQGLYQSTQEGSE